MRNLWNCGVSAMTLATVLTAGATWSEDKGAPLYREARSSDLPAMGVITPQENDRRIARWLTVDSRMILECAKFGREHAQRPEVKHFAEMLVTDHEKCQEDLRATKARTEDRTKAEESKVKNQSDKETRREETDSAQQSKNTKSDLGDNSTDRSRTAVLIQDDGKSRDERMVYHPTDFLAVREEVSHQMLDIARKDWDTLSGVDFDNAFVRHQILAHEMMIASIKSVRPGTSTTMRTSLDRSLEQLKNHLKTARELSHSTVSTTSNDR